MKKCFQTGGGFAVWVEEPDPAEPAPEPTPAPAPAEPAPEVDQGDCDGCASKPSNQPPKVP